MSHGGQDVSTAAAAAGPLRVEIGVLSLDGVSRAQGRAIAAALRRELGRLLADRSAQRWLRETAARGPVRAMDAGRMRLLPSDRADHVGARIAQGVARGLLGAPGIRSGR